MDDLNEAAFLVRKRTEALELRLSNTVDQLSYTRQVSAPFLSLRDGLAGARSDF